MFDLQAVLLMPPVQGKTYLPLAISIFIEKALR